MEPTSVHTLCGETEIILHPTFIYMFMSVFADNLDTNLEEMEMACRASQR